MIIGCYDKVTDKTDEIKVLLFFAASHQWLRDPLGFPDGALTGTVRDPSFSRFPGQMAETALGDSEPVVPDEIICIFPVSHMVFPENSIFPALRRTSKSIRRRLKTIWSTLSLSRTGYTRLSDCRFDHQLPAFSPVSSGGETNSGIHKTLNRDGSA